MRLRHLHTLALALAAATACSGDGATVPTRDASVILNFLTPATVRAVSVTVSGPGISPAVIRNIPVGADSTARDTLVLTAGTGRRFVFAAFDTAGVETHRADTTVTLLAGTNAPLAVRLMPLASTVGITITFGGVRLAVADTSTRIVAVGDSVIISANGTTATSTVVPRDSLRWGSSNPAVARVVGGVVTGIRPGNATVTASFRGAAAVVRVTVQAIPRATQRGYFTVGGSHGCGLTSAGAAHCWGRNSDGQLGDGTVAARSGPVAVGGGQSFQSISAGFNYTCALTAAGATWCWGNNDRGQLGNGSLTPTSTPATVSTSLAFVTLSAGGAHVCGLTSAGDAYCWGSNELGQLGDGTTTHRSTPTRVSGDVKFASIQASWHSTCGLTSAGVAYCWGDNAYGEIGDSSFTQRTTPTSVAGGRTYASIGRLSFGHACGVTATGSGWCWGLNGTGQLGDGSTTSRTVPVAVGGGVAYAMVSAGGYHTCGLDANGAAFCWGYNLYGQLGTGTNANASAPQAVQGFTFQMIATGGYFTCALDLEGLAYCWGANGTQELGIGATGDRNRPTRVAGTLRFGPP